MALASDRRSKWWSDGGRSKSRHPLEEEEEEEAVEVLVGSQKLRFPFANRVVVMRIKKSWRDGDSLRKRRDN